MENLILLFTTSPEFSMGAGILAGTLVGSGIVLLSKPKEVIKEIFIENKKHIDIIEANEIILMFDSLLEKKFKYYNMIHFLAVFQSGKEPDIEVVKGIKQSFYTDISNTLSKDMEDLLIKIYNAKGLDLYIHQSFLRLLNEANIKYRVKDDINPANLKTFYTEGA